MKRPIALVIVALSFALLLILPWRESDSDLTQGSSPAPRAAPPREPGPQGSALMIPVSGSAELSTPRPPASEEPSPIQAAPRPESYRPWREAPPALRGVSGRVVDALSGAPIPGAWLSWRRPTPSLAERFLDGKPRSDPALRMITDAEGRFQLERLPDEEEPSGRLSVIALGYATRSVTVGLRRELKLALRPTGRLELKLSSGRPPSPLRILPLDGKPGAKRFLKGYVPEFIGAHLSLGALPPGRYRVQVGAQEKLALVTPGRRSELAFVMPTALRQEGIFSGLEGERGSLIFRQQGASAGTFPEAKLDPDGRFSLRLRPGVYDIDLRLGFSERRIASAKSLDGSPLSLSIGELGEVLNIELSEAGQAVTSDELGLVSEDGLNALFIERRGPKHLTRALLGRYLLFDGHRFLGLVENKGAALRIERKHRSVSISVKLPADLGSEERIRGSIVAIPEPATRLGRLSARYLLEPDAQFRAAREGVILELELSWNGRFKLLLDSDLGSRELWLEAGAKAARFDLR